MGSNDNNNDVLIYRRRKQKKNKPKFSWVTAVKFAVAATIILVIVVNSASIIPLFEGIIPKITGKKRVEKDRFPVKLPSSAVYVLNEYENGLALLGDAYIYAYFKDGALNYALQHGYNNPAISANSSSGKTFLAYDRNGKKFSVYNSKGELFNRNSEERIVFAQIGNTDFSAVVYKDDFYENTLEVYDGQGAWRYRRKVSDEHVVGIAFDDLDEKIIVSTIGFDASSGNGTAHVHKYDLYTEESVWDTALGLNVLPLAISAYYDNDKVYVLCSTVLYSLDLNSGEILGRTSYSGDLIDFSFSDNYVALITGDYISGTTSLIVADNEASLIGSISLSSSSMQTEIYGEEVYVLDDAKISRYSIDLDELTPELTIIEELELDGEYSKFVKIGEDYYLLSYDAIEKLTVNEELEEEEPPKI